MGREMTADSHSIRLGPHPGAAKLARLAVDRWLGGWTPPELLVTCTW
jgi:hypothetical protein